MNSATGQLTERQLAGLESLEEADVMYYDDPEYIRDLSIKFLDDAMLKLSLPKHRPPYPGGGFALFTTDKGRKYLADMLWNAPQFEGRALPVHNYEMATQLVDEFFADENMELPTE